MELAKRKFRESIEGLDSDYTTRVRFAFVRKFWDTNARRLLDTVNEFTSDPSIRPNSLFAVSLPFSPLSADQQKTVMRTLKAELFTPYGLRSLSPNDLRYRGVCQGENWVRELAYHQGSVWPWFLAHFAEALLKTEPKSKETPALFTAVTDAFAGHLRECGVGSVSEVFDGDEPHTPRGAISQAWNVAELLRFLQVTG
jgi:glycogen debranching enzyme